MNKLNERLTLIANISVVFGIIFLAVELQQNTQAIQAQTRDSITEKQMTYSLEIGSGRDAADVFVRGNADLDELDSTEQQMYRGLTGAILREFENSHYQYERGLFSADEFESRLVRWQNLMVHPGMRDIWDSSRETFSASFRAEIDRIVAEVAN